MKFITVLMIGLRKFLEYLLENDAAYYFISVKDKRTGTELAYDESLTLRDARKRAHELLLRNGLLSTYADIFRTTESGVRTSRERIYVGA